MAKITTIKLDGETKARLDHLKEHDRETYDHIIKKVLYILNEIRKDPVSGNRILGKIDSNIGRKKAYEKSMNNKNNKNEK
jgi:hypothetical protein